MESRCKHTCAEGHLKTTGAKQIVNKSVGLYIIIACFILIQFKRAAVHSELDPEGNRRDNHPYPQTVIITINIHTLF